MLKPGTFVRYHGSDEVQRGYAFKVVGPCDCAQCYGWSPGLGPVRKRHRIKLADLIAGGITCVREWHVTAITEEEARAEPCVTIDAAYSNYET